MLKTTDLSGCLTVAEVDFSSIVHRKLPREQFDRASQADRGEENCWHDL
jgi:hypothetical protein